MLRRFTNARGAYGVLRHTHLILLFALLGLIAGCQPTTQVMTPTLPAATPVPVAPTVAATMPAPATPTTAVSPTRPSPSPTVGQSPISTPSPSPTVGQSPISSPPSPTPRRAALSFGLEQSTVLLPILGQANVFGRTRVPADPSAFAPDNAIRTDPGAFRGWRGAILQALEEGEVAFVLEMGVSDPTEVVAQRARNLALMHPTQRPWLIIIGNELNLRRMADYPVETYYAQLRAAYDAVKAVSPTTLISTDGQNYWEGAPHEHPMADPNASDRLRALLRVFEREQWAPDVITIHVFDSVWAPGSGRDVYSLVGRTRFYRDIVSGFKLPRSPTFFLGEFGLPVTEPIPSEQRGKYWRFFITEREQADLAFMAGVWSAATGSRLNYFGGKDTPPEGLRRNERGEIVEGVYGLVASDGRKRPAFVAYERAQDLLRGATGEIVSNGVDGVGAACFTLAQGGQLCAAQATTGRGGRLTTPPLPAGVRFRVEDVLGQPIEGAARQERDGRVIVELPGAAAQKTGGAVRVLVIEP